MTDANDFLDRVNRSGQNHAGVEQYGPEEVKANFDLYGPKMRAEAMDQLDAEIRSITEVGHGEGELRKYAALQRLRRELGAKHQTLMKVGR